jgi:regulator of RNase E activity RraA
MLARFVRASAPVGSQIARQQAVRCMAHGPAAGGHVSDEMLDKLATLSTQALIDGLWVMGWPSSFIEGARPLAKGQKCAGRAVTLNFVPHRPDIQMDKPAGADSPEYEAFEKCGPREVLVMASVGPWESVGGDIKFLRLKQLKVGGLVTDGSVRDTDEILSYGFPVFSFSTTAKQGPAIMQPWECNGVIECGKVAVRPGDAIIGDQDGVVVVPAAVAEKVYELAHGREVIEKVIKAELVENPGPPGIYYPFKPPIKPESPLGKLLTRKGVKF